MQKSLLDKNQQFILLNGGKQIKVMDKSEIKWWIGRWSKLKPSPIGDMVIKIWSKGLQKRNKGYENKMVTRY